MAPAAPSRQWDRAAHDTADDRTRPDRLLALVRRIAHDDRRAFADLHETLSAGVRAAVEQTLPEPADAAAVTCATFVEVWWLAGFHVTPHANVGAWITAIAARRTGDRLDARDPGCAADRTRQAPGDGNIVAAHDRQNELALARLLELRPRAV